MATLPFKRLSSFVCSGLVVVVLSGITFAADPQIYVGRSEISITPDRPVALEGAFALRISDGIESPITANVVVLESRQADKVVEQSVMVNADLVHLPMEMVHAVRKKSGGENPQPERRQDFH